MKTDDFIYKKNLKTKKIILFALLVTGLISLGVLTYSYSRARLDTRTQAGYRDLSFQFIPNSSIVPAGESFTTTLSFKTGEGSYQITAAKVLLNYDRNKIMINQVSLAPYLALNKTLNPITYDGGLISAELAVTCTGTVCNLQNSSSPLLIITGQFLPGATGTATISVDLAQTAVSALWHSVSIFKHNTPITFTVTSQTLNPSPFKK